MAPESAKYPNVKSEACTLNSLSRAWCRLWGSTVWLRKNFADVPADFVVILGTLHENRRNLLSEWAFDCPFLLLVRKEWFREWLRLLQQAC